MKPLVQKQGLIEMLATAKLVLINDPDKKDDLHKIARLYYHDQEKNEALLMVDRLRIHELKSASVVALGK